MPRPERPRPADDSRAARRALTLLRQRLERQWPPGSRLPPIKRLAADLDCGQTNTQRAVQRLVAEGVLVSRPGLGTFVQGAGTARTAPVRRNDAGDGGPSVQADPALWAGALRRRSVALMVVGGPFQDPFLPDLLPLLQAEIIAAGGRVSVEPVHYDSDGAVLQHRDGSSDRADAVIQVNLPARPAARCADRQLLVVLSTQIPEVDMPSRYDVVSADAEGGGYLAGKHLRALGCTSACFIGSNPYVRISAREYDPTCAAKLRGFELGWGQTLPAALHIHRAFYTSEAGAAAVRDFLKLDPRPAAVFAATDNLAIGFIHGATAHGLRPLRDYQIIGFGGHRRGRELQTGPLTTLDAPITGLARAAVRLLAERFADPDQPPRRLSLGCTLFNGRTTAQRG